MLSELAMQCFSNLHSEAINHISLQKKRALDLGNLVKGRRVKPNQKVKPQEFFLILVFVFQWPSTRPSARQPWSCINLICMKMQGFHRFAPMESTSLTSKPLFAKHHEVHLAVRTCKQVDAFWFAPVASQASEKTWKISTKDSKAWFCYYFNEL